MTTGSLPKATPDIQALVNSLTTGVWVSERFRTYLAGYLSQAYGLHNAHSIQTLKCLRMLNQTPIRAKKTIFAARCSCPRCEPARRAARRQRSPKNQIVAISNFLGVGCYTTVARLPTSSQIVESPQSKRWCGNSKPCLRCTKNPSGVRSVLTIA